MCVIEIFIFILGAAFSVVLVPYAEAQRLSFVGKMRMNLLLTEIEDIQVELERDVRAYFMALLNIRTQPDLAANGRVPFPVATPIDVSLVSRLYEETATLMTHEQRMAVKSIQSAAQQIYQAAFSAQQSLTEEKTYCVASLKNVVRLSASEALRLKSFLSLKEQFVSANVADSFKATEEMLVSLGFTEEQISASRIRESLFHDVEIKF